MTLTINYPLITSMQPMLGKFNPDNYQSMFHNKKHASVLRDLLVRWGNIVSKHGSGSRLSEIYAMRVFNCLKLNLNRKITKFDLTNKSLHFLKVTFDKLEDFNVELKKRLDDNLYMYTLPDYSTYSFQHVVKQQINKRDRKRIRKFLETLSKIETIYKNIMVENTIEFLDNDILDQRIPTSLIPVITEFVF